MQNHKHNQNQNHNQPSPTAQGNEVALLIVDLQNDFLHPSGAYARGGAVSEKARALPAKVEQVAKRIKENAGLVVASQFTLWPGTGGEPLISDHLKKLRPFLKKGDFQPMSWGQQNVDTLKDLIDLSVSKVAYSAFFNTQLDWVLARAGIKELVVCGIVTNGGVASSVRDAHVRDYRCTVLGDGCAAFSEQIHETSLADLKTVATVTTCEAYLSGVRS
jgi:nicotinamidase-related amidase